MALKSKAQISFEYLSLFGISILIFTITLMTVINWDTLDIKQFYTEKCWLGDQFFCNDYQLGITSGNVIMNVRVQSDFTKSVRVLEMKSVSEDYDIYGCTLPADVSPKQLVDVSCFVNGSISPGDKPSIPVTIRFHDNESITKPEHVVSGLVRAKIPNDPTIVTAPACNDGLDNDGNGCIDFSGADSGCTDVYDNDESGGICPLSCTISSSCSGIEIMGLSNLTDSHAEIPSSSNFMNSLCCQSSTDTLSNSCASPDAILAKLSSMTDAHVQMTTVSTYPVDVCLSASPGTMTCAYRSICNPGERCLLSLTQGTDAHVGQCGDYSQKLCCRIV